MNASAPAAAELPVSITTPSNTALHGRDGVVVLPQGLSLHHGGRLEELRVAWHLAGPSDGPLVAVLGGISAERIVSAEEGGWWHALVGHGRGVDTQAFQVLGIDYLGGSGGSTGPGRHDESFQTVSTFDQAAALLAVLEALGIQRLHAIVGASYGGMVALAFAERYPQRVERLVVTSAGERTHPLSTAWRSVQREMVRFGIRHQDSAGGLKLARALAMATYRSGREFAERFAGDPTRDAQGVLRFPVESYLHARGEDYAARHIPAAFLCLSESIDLHHIQPSAINTPTTLVAVMEDQLVPLADLHSLAAGLPCATLHVVSSAFGHDAFLKERELLGPLFSQALLAPVSLTQQALP